MRSTILVIALFLALPFLAAQFSIAQEVEGNGKIVKKFYSISSFDRIELNGIYNTVIKQGNTESVEIEADENLQAYLKPEVNDRTLQIEQTEGVRFKKNRKMNVYVTFKNIDKITNNGVGNLTSDGTINLSQLAIACNGVGNLELELNSSKLNLEMSSVGNIELSGSVTDGEFMLSGVGNIDAENMKIENLKIDNSGVGNAEVYVTGVIRPSVSGAGNIICKGKPSVSDLKQNGIGRFRLK